jgi:GT2 family glycosyltransferase
MRHRLCLVVATKDRPEDLHRLFDSLSSQTLRPDEVVVVDASRSPISLLMPEFAGLRLKYVRHLPPSAAAQRNAGIAACDNSATLVGFADDDTVFECDAIEKMLRFWDSASADVLGASFNIRNYSPPGGQWLKRSALVRWLGLYASEPGAVAPSGWQTVMTEVTENLTVEWLPSTAVVWRSDVLAQDRFDEFFDGYSYLEDLDFSYSASRRGRLVVVAQAGYSHFPSAGGRVSARRFGRVEVRNRLYLVKKHRLSITRCWIALWIRFAMTCFGGVTRWNPAMLDRAAGNLLAILQPDA